MLNILLTMVRTKTKWKNITVSENVYNRIEKDREEFERDIKGGKWSFNDALCEWIKILNSIKSE